MRKISGHSCVSALGLLLAGTALTAQVTSGQLDGTVTNQKGDPLPGARVIIKSPQLMMQREIVAGPKGEWRAPLLPPGNYQITFAMNGYVGKSIANVRVGVGTSIRQDASLKSIATVEAVVEVVGVAAAADKTETKTATNFSSDELERLSGDRGFANATDFTSGIVNGPQGTAIIRGGMTSGNVYSVNGNDVKDPYWGQVGATWFLPDSVEDVQVILSPLNARNGRTLGGTVNVVTKSGGNDFEGTLRWTPSRSTNWQARSHNWVDRGWDERTDNYSSQTNLTISGPIIKDRLWFALGTYFIPETTSLMSLEAEPDTRFRRPVRTGIPAIDQQTALNSDLTSASRAGYSFPTFNFSQPYTATQKHKYYDLKLTLAATANHRISVFGSQEKSTSTPAWAVSFSTDQINPTEYNNSQYGLDYTGILGSATTLEARFTHSSQKYTDNYGSTRRDPNHTGIALYLDDVSPAATKNTWFQFANQNLSGMGLGSSDNRANTNLGINLKMFREAFGLQHDIDTGVDYYRSEFATVAMRGGLNEFVTVGGVLQASDGSWVFPTIVWPGAGNFGQNADSTRGLAPTLYKYYGHDGTAKNPDLGLYINDQMTLSSHWNLMFGLRFDQVKCIDTTGSTLISSSNWSPRFVATYDLKGNSEHVIKFSFSRLASDYPMQLTSQFYTSASSTGAHLVWTGINGQQAIPSDGSVTSANVGNYLKWVTMAQLLDESNYGNPISFYDNTKAWRVDPHLKPMMCNEYSLEYKHGFQDGSFTRMAYIYRKFSNLIATATDYDPSYWAIATDTTGAGLRPKYIRQTTVFNSDDLWRDYHGLELEASVRQNSVFSTRFSYTYSRLRGNDNSLDGTSTQYYGDTSTLNGRYNYRTFTSVAPLSAVSPGGSLRNDIPHRCRVTEQMLLPVGKGGWVNFAAVFRYDSGGNWDATAPDTFSSGMQTVYNSVQAAAAANPNAPNAVALPTTWTRYYADRGAYHFNDSYQMDLNITWEVPVWRSVRFIGLVAITNVFNHTLQTSYDTTADPGISSGTSHYLVNAAYFGGTRQDSFGDYNFWNNPRTVTFNAGFKF